MGIGNPLSFLEAKDSKSSNNTTDNKKIINSTDIKVMSKSISENISNTVISNASTCGASSLSSQQMNLSNVNITDSSDVTLGQDNEAILNFSCVQESTVRADVANDLAKKLMDNIQNSNSSDMLGELEASASAKMKNSALSFGQSGASSGNNNNIDYTMTNNTNINIEHVIQNSITNNFKNEDIKACNSNMVGMQEMNVNGATIKNSQGVNLTQRQVVASYSECKQIQDASNKIINTIIEDLGATIVNDTKSEQSTKTKLETKSETIQKGLIESIGDVFSNPWFIVGLIVVFIFVVIVIMLIARKSPQGQALSIVTSGLGALGK